MGAQMKDVEACVYLLHYEGKPMYKSRRVYFSERDAKIGIRNLTVDLDREKIEIVRYIPEVAEVLGEE